jgi:hypothetical protein
LLRISAALAHHHSEPRRERSTPTRDRKIKSSKEQKMTKNNVGQSYENGRRTEPNLDSRYGQIGISAVAAALQYQSEVKNPAYAPVVH